MRGDYLESYLLMSEINIIGAWSPLPRGGDSRTRGHMFTVKEERFNRNQKDTFTTQRVVGIRDK